MVSKHLPDDCRAIMGAMIRVSNMADHEVPYNGFHHETGLDAHRFDAAVSTLIRLKHVEKFVLYGQVRMRITPQ